MEFFESDNAYNNTITNIKKNQDDIYQKKNKTKIEKEETKMTLVRLRLIYSIQFMFVFFRC